MPSQGNEGKEIFKDCLDDQLASEIYLNGICLGCCSLGQVGINRATEICMESKVRIQTVGYKRENSHTLQKLNRQHCQLILTQRRLVLVLISTLFSDENVCFCRSTLSNQLCWLALVFCFGLKKTKPGLQKIDSIMLSPLVESLLLGKYNEPHTGFLM